MHRWFVTIAAMFGAVSASAQTFTTHTNWLVEAVPGTFYANGVGAPTVAYDPAQGLYVMFFETMLSAPDAVCTVGQWGIGAASSIDGLNWTVEPNPILVPEPGTAHSCVIAHPVVVLDGDRWRLWFKGEQGKNESGPWGIARQTGVGYAEGRIIVETTVAGQIAALNTAQAQNTADINALLNTINANPAIDAWKQASDVFENLYGVQLEIAIDNAENPVKALMKAAKPGKKRSATKALTASSQIIDALPAVMTQLTPYLADPATLTFYNNTVALLATVRQYQDALNQLLIAQNDIQAQLAAVQGGITTATRFVMYPRSNPVLNVNGFGYPAVTKVGTTWYMLVAKVPDLYLATSSSPDTGWVMDTLPVMQPGVTSWTQDEIFNPSMVCEDAGPFPFTLYFGGRNLLSTYIDLGGWGEAISNDSQTWWISALAQFQWTGGDKWRHWDAMRVGSDYLAWFSEKDALGHNRIGLSYTMAAGPVWDPAAISPRICP